MNSRLRNPGAKRLMLEAKELQDNTEDYCAQPVEDNLVGIPFEWHFTIRGPPDSCFEGGVYHGQLRFPTEYPLKPPSIYLLTPNGRFKTNEKICLSISGYHPETWLPSWSVRTALLALMCFMPTKSNNAIGSLNYPDWERRDLARKSRSWKCPICGPVKDLLKNPTQNIESMTGSDVNYAQSTRVSDITVSSSLSASESVHQQIVHGFHMTHGPMVWLGSNLRHLLNCQFALFPLALVVMYIWNKI